MAKKVTQIIEKQINTWSRRNSLDDSPSKQKRNDVYPTITISREFGSPGAALAEYLGARTEFEVWDKKLLKAIAEELGSDQKFIETLDERRQQAVEDAVAAFITNLNTNVNYLHSLIRIVRTVEDHGKSIIVGRGANYICEHNNSLHVRLVAPLKHRINYYARRKNLSVEEVRKLAERKDRERTEFIRQNFQKDVSNPLDYDLIINSEKYDLEQMAKIVLSVYKIKTGKTVELKMQEKNEYPG
jgi:cytidylate kinase